MLGMLARSLSFGVLQSTKVVGGDYNAIFELQRYYGCSSYDGRLCMLVGTVRLEVRSIVGTVDVVAWLVCMLDGALSYSFEYILCPKLEEDGS